MVTRVIINTVKVVRVARTDQRDAIMAERPGGSGGGGFGTAKRRSRRDSGDATGSSGSRGTPASSSSKERRTKRASKPMKERWLLTRKTWRYMADAGRRLIPDGAHNRAEDLPRIEQYFQEVCQKEPKFLLWRKASYPGTLSFRTHRHRRLVKGGSCRTKASSADEADDSRGSGSSTGGQNLLFQATSGGRFDVAKTKRDWLLATGSGSTPASPVSRRRAPQEDAEVKALADMLQKYLNMQNEGSSGPTGPPVNLEAKDIEKAAAAAASKSSANIPFDYQSLISKLQQHLDFIMGEGKKEEKLKETGQKDGQSESSSMLPYRGDYVHKSLIETLSRHYSKSPNREHVISGILTDRKLLEKLYFDLRCTRGFRGPRATGAYTSPSRWWGTPRTRPSSKGNDNNCLATGGSSGRKEISSPPPLIAVQGPSTDRGPVDGVVQTDPIARNVLEALRAEREKEEAAMKESIGHKTLSGRRRSSVDHDDVSPSVSDTIKRYLRMARKKSIDADKADRFKRVNYDRNLRNIKAKGEITKPGDDDGNNKGCQTEDNWIISYRENVGTSSPDGNMDNFSDADTASPASRNASSRSSMDAGLGSEEQPSTPKHHHHQSFLSHLLHGSNAHKDKPHSAPGSPALTSSSNSPGGGTAMQKSKSSSSVVHHGSRLVAKKIWRSRSKSTSRTVNQPSVWTPQVSVSLFASLHLSFSFLLFFVVRPLIFELHRRRRAYKLLSSFVTRLSFRENQ